jgi:hypothetical protein
MLLVRFYPLKEKGSLLGEEHEEAVFGNNVHRRTRGSKKEGEFLILHSEGLHDLYSVQHCYDSEMKGHKEREIKTHRKLL